MNRKFIRRLKRNLLDKERLVEMLSRVVLIAASLLACLWMVSGAHASNPSIKGIKAKPLPDGSYVIDFLLSQKLGTENVSVEFERNFIQVSLKGVSAYPSRTEKINEGFFERVFTYQYQPDLARARVLLKTSASNIREKASWKVTPDGVRIQILGAAEKVASDLLTSKAASSSQAAYSASDLDEDRMVQQILKEAKGENSSPMKTSEEKPILGEKKDAPASNEDQLIFAAKSAEPKPKESSVGRVIASLLLVVGLIGAIGLAFRRFGLGKGGAFLRSNRVIEVVANQSLGPKRSIALIKVMDQYMVVGMAGDGMSLLSNLGNDVQIEKYLDQMGGPGSSFSDSLEGALGGGSGAEKTDTAGPPLTQKAAQIELGVRSSIRKRLAGFKPL